MQSWASRIGQFRPGIGAPLENALGSTRSDTCLFTPTTLPLALALALPPTPALHQHQHRCHRPRQTRRHGTRGAKCPRRRARGDGGRGALGAHSHTPPPTCGCRRRPLTQPVTAPGSSCTRPRLYSPTFFSTHTSHRPPASSCSSATLTALDIRTCLPLHQTAASSPRRRCPHVAVVVGPRQPTSRAAPSPRHWR